MKFSVLYILFEVGGGNPNPNRVTLRKRLYFYNHVLLGINHFKIINGISDIKTDTNDI